MYRPTRLMSDSSSRTPMCRSEDKNSKCLGCKCHAVKWAGLGADMAVDVEEGRVAQAVGDAVNGGGATPLSPPPPEWSELDAAQVLAEMATGIVEKESDGSSSGEEWRSNGKRLKRAQSELPLREQDFGMSKLQIDCNKAYDVVEQGTIPPPPQTLNREPLKPHVNRLSSRISSNNGRGKQNLTETEKEERRFRRVLANRESARQTIRRRQAFREGLIRRAADLTLINQNMKMEKHTLTIKYQSLKDKNQQLKEQITEVLNCKLQPSIGAAFSSQRAKPAMVHLEVNNRFPFVPFAWPSWPLIPSECPPATCGFYMPHCTWLRPHQISQSLPVHVNQTCSVNCSGIASMHPRADSSSSVTVSGTSENGMRGMASEFDLNRCLDVRGKSVAGDALPACQQGKEMAVDLATEARKRRKELTRLKHLHGRQSISGCMD